MVQVQEDYLPRLAFRHNPNNNNNNNRSSLINNSNNRNSNSNNSNNRNSNSNNIIMRPPRPTQTRPHAPPCPE